METQIRRLLEEKSNQGQFIFHSFLFCKSALFHFLGVIIKSEFLDFSGSVELIVINSDNGCFVPCSTYPNSCF